ncbi:unnamed protein product [Caenorhabditis angaria]|uniref:Uncharacterized protein n=1 Tax=Caenorhabditis angaria TaxID=860376 RepID=A0A9P1IH21_9PELO|nr:unnamed protein product [Caenorhabditis angaria]
MTTLNLRSRPNVPPKQIESQSKLGSCSPPSLASTGKNDGELDMRKTLFSASVLEKFRDFDMPESEKIEKINQMWKAMDETNRMQFTENILKRKENNKESMKNKRMKFEGRPSIEYNPQKPNPIVTSQKNIELVAKALGVTNPTPSTSTEVVDVKPPPLRQEKQKCHADLMRSRLQFHFFRSSLEQAKSFSLNKSIKEELKVEPPPSVVEVVESMRLTSSEKLEQIPVKKDVKEVLFKKPPMSKPLQSTYTIPAVQNPEVPKTKAKTTCTLVPAIQNCELSKSKPQKTEVKKIFKRAPPVKKVSYEEACRIYYFELSRRFLLDDFNDIPKPDNLQKLANIVEGWKVTDYHGLL